MVIILTLKEFFRNNQNARKIFGKKEIDIIIRQLEGKNLTQSERNRLSRDIRPKLQFIKDIGKFEGEFGLEKNQENNRLIEGTVSVILNDKLSEDIKAILLFGSYADKTYTFRSDIDICVVFKKDLPLDESTRFRIRIAGQLPEKIDIQVFNILPQKIKRDIARNHKVLYRAAAYDNIEFSIKYLKDEDYFIRMRRLMEA
ncbi:MAG TPA: nucleotidyltransferase domain-containing protein [Candidatus Nanoarchaeia archaeon]|nr:nucleotidyltransferase domain-containing protein [Candidatus Nanoarchaeia archaeon]